MKGASLIYIASSEKITRVNGVMCGVQFAVCGFKFSKNIERTESIIEAKASYSMSYRRMLTLISDVDDIGWIQPRLKSHKGLTTR